MAEERLSPDELQDAWPVLAVDERVEALRLLARDEAEDVFLNLPAREQEEVISAMPASERRSWMRLLAPDDAADVIQAASPEQRELLLSLLDSATRTEVTALLAHAEDQAGGLMNPRYARLRPDMTVDEAIRYLNRQTREGVETIYYSYVLDADQRLLGVVSFRELFKAAADKKIRDVMNADVVTIGEDLDQEAAARVYAEHDLMALPVVDAAGRMKGIVTHDDIVDVVQEEATEDIQKMGGVAALEAPYLEVGFGEMLTKRAGWLTVLFFGELLTATAMGFFEHEISKAVVLALFIPLIISSGGNSGSQATTLVIRAMALGEVRLRDWWRVVKRELVMGLALGTILGVLGLVRIVAWEKAFGSYGVHWLGIGITVAVSLLGVVLWGTVVGSMLPLLLQRLRLDPASASAPLVATLVDVTGLVIYFTVASLALSGALV